MANRQYDEMFAAAAARLSGRVPRDIANMTGADYDPSDDALTLVSLGENVRVSCGDWTIQPPLEMWHHLALLQYLDSADGSVPGTEWIGLSEFPGGGQSRGASFDREIGETAARGLSALSPERIRQACLRLGGIIVEDPRADLCAVFHFAPRWPLMLNLWFADDEFPASAKVRLNRAVSRCLGLEAAGTVAALMMKRICM